MVDIDTVYQRVLALANKEQRGYITPQEFNLFANQAQIEIFEQYFYDIDQDRRRMGNDAEFSDRLYILNEKLSIFEIERGTAWTQLNLGANMILPEEIYRLGTVKVDSNNVEILTSKQFDDAVLTPLTSPTISRPIGYLTSNILNIAIEPGNFVNANNSAITISYIRLPQPVSWGYFVVGSKALFDANSAATNHFELHASEETELVYRILKFAGVSMKRDDIMKAGQGLESLQIQQEKQ